MTILNWVNRVRRKLKLGPVTSLTDTGGHWTIAEMLDIYNDRADELCEETKCLRESSVISAVEDQREYDFESDWVDILGVLYDNEPLLPFDVNALDFSEQYLGLNAAWRAETDTKPYGWYLGDATGKFGLIDAPSADDTDAVTVLHTINPDHFTTASTATTELLNGHGHLKPYHSALVDFGIAECEAEDGNVEKAAIFEQRGQRKMQKLKLKIKYPKHLLPSMLNTKSSQMAGTRRFWTR